MKEINPLWAYTIIFLVSLFGAYITFGLLESTGTVENDNIKLGGSIAGFFAIFIAFARLYSSDINKLRELESTKNASFWATLDFNDSSVNFSEKNNGRYEILNEKGESIGGDVMIEFKVPGGWGWKLPVTIGSNHSIYMNIVDDEKHNWVIKQPINITLKPRRRGS